MSTEDTWPPRTPHPEHPRLSGAFDRLINSNLQLTKTVNAAVIVMVALTFIAVVIAGYSALTVQTMAKMIQCKEVSK